MKGRYLAACALAAALGCASDMAGQRAPATDMQAPAESSLEAALATLRADYPDLFGIMQRHDIKFIEVSDSQKAAQMRASARSSLYCQDNTRLWEVLVYTARQPVEVYAGGRKKLICPRTLPLILTDIIHEVLEIDYAERHLLSGKLPEQLDKEACHRSARRRQLDYDAGLSIEEYISIFSQYLDSGGREFPSGIRVNAKNRVVVNDIVWCPIEESQIAKLEEVRNGNGRLEMPFTDCSGNAKSVYLQWRKNE